MRLIEYRTHHVICFYTFSLAFKRKDQTVTHRRDRHRSDVLSRYMETPLEQGASAAPCKDGLCSPGTRPMSNIALHITRSILIFGMSRPHHTD